MVCPQPHSVSHFYRLSTRVSKSAIQNQFVCHIPVPLLYPSFHQSPFYVKRLHVVFLHIIDRYQSSPTRWRALYINRRFHKPHESSTSPLCLPFNPKALCPQPQLSKNLEPRTSHHATSKQPHSSHHLEPRSKTIKAPTTPPSHYPPSLHHLPETSPPPPHPPPKRCAGKPPGPSPASTFGPSNPAAAPTPSPLRANYPKPAP